jgi:predicted 2-oxoglutarate/Fe(II)-dependent dioxygenase YbiX
MNDIGKNPKDIVEINSILIKKGSLIVFPSDMWHRVLPVTKGVRISLVGWCYGYPFK